MPRINIEIPDELHKQCKIAAVSKGIPLKTLLTQLLEEAL